VFPKRLKENPLLVLLQPFLGSSWELLFTSCVTALERENVYLYALPFAGIHS
jgi:hypothetical protein